MNTSLRATVTAIALALLSAACSPEANEDVAASAPEPQSPDTGSPDTLFSDTSPLVTLSCESDLNEIVALLQSGLPTYDYDPATDLEALLEQSAVVMTGTIRSLVRPSGADEGWTIVSADAPQILYSFPEPVRDISQFSISSHWADGLGDDPIENAVGVEGVSFVAFLLQWSQAPGGYTVAVQGMVVACTGSADPPLAIIAPLPADGLGQSLDALVAQVKQVGEDSLAALRSGLDGPVMRHRERPEIVEAHDLQIGGILELEGDCLYLRSPGAERYPIVWPSDTRWDAAREVVMTPAGDQIGITDEVEGGGGYLSLDKIEPIAGPEAASLAESCLDNEYGEVVVVNNLDSAIRRADS